MSDDSILSPLRERVDELTVELRTLRTDVHDLECARTQLRARVDELEARLDDGDGGDDA